MGRLQECLPLRATFEPAGLLQASQGGAVLMSKTCDIRCLLLEVALRGRLRVTARLQRMLETQAALLRAHNRAIVFPVPVSWCEAS